MPFVFPRGDVDLARPVRSWRGKAVGQMLVSALGRVSPGGRPVNRISSPAQARRGPFPRGLTYATLASSGMWRATMRRSFVMQTVDPALTLLAVFRTTTAATSGTFAALGSDTGASGDTLCVMSTGAASAARIRFFITDAGGSTIVDVTSGTTTTNDGRWHCVIATSQWPATATTDMYIDGVADGSAAVGVGTPTGTTFQHVCANGTRRTTDSNGTAAIDVALVVPIFGKLDAFEGVSLSANPWQLFRAVDLMSMLGGGSAAAVAFVKQAGFAQRLAGNGGGLAA